MTTYRVAYGLEERERAEVAQKQRLLAERAPQLAEVATRRNARIAGGLVGVLGVPAVLAAAIVTRSNETPAMVFAGSIAASFLAYGLVRLLGRARLPASWPRIERSFEDLEAWSVGLPLVAAALLGPLALHGIVYAAVTVPFPSPWAKPLENFTVWMAMSGAIVGHAHLVLAVLAARFASKLAKTPTENLGTNEIRRAWVRAFLYTLLVSALPGVILFAIPPLLVFVTGIILVPAMYLVAIKTVSRDRLVLDETETAIANVRVGIEEIEEAREELYVTAARSSA